MMTFPFTMREDKKAHVASSEFKLASNKNTGNSTKIVR